MILAVTGHRPDKLGGYSDAAYEILVDFAVEELSRFGRGKLPKPLYVITGMALGWDQAVAQACVRLGIPFWAAVPFKGQEKLWPDSSQKRYYELLNEAEGMVYVTRKRAEPGISLGGISEWMQVRNRWMCEHSDTLLALWNGTPGGTANCVRYGRSLDRTVINCWERWEEFQISLGEKQ